MFSDFALKALIGDWEEARLGPNPFLNVGSFSDSFDLKFSPEELKACPSAQLQKVGALCENGKAHVHAMSGTIAFTVSNTRSDTNKYKLQVLSVATRLGSDSSCSCCGNNLIKHHDHKGAAGHVLLTYPSGGKLLVSCGHWIELARLDVSEASLLKVATAAYGEVESAKIRTELESASNPMFREEIVQKYSKQYVQETSPAMYSCSKNN